MSLVSEFGSEKRKLAENEEVDKLVSFLSPM